MTHTLMSDEVFNLGLHQKYTDRLNHLTVVRVIGGWIYRLEDQDWGVFVPYSQVYMERKMREKKWDGTNLQNGID